MEGLQEPVRGWIRKYHSHLYHVDIDGGVYGCVLKGLLKKEGVEVLVGDWVWVDTLDEANRTGRVTQVVLPRKNELQRPKIANVDAVILVAPLREPDFDPRHIDRTLVHIAMAGLPVRLCVTKCDLAASVEEIEAIRSLYVDRLGYAVHFTSIKTGEGLEAIRRAMTGQKSVLAGASGAGKSSLLNALSPGLNLRVGDVSEKLGRGQHTTRHVELLPLADLPDTFVADSPGFSALTFAGLTPPELSRLFPEFASYREHCGFSDCLHEDEDGCAVREHLAEIPETRYAHYREMLAEVRQVDEQAKRTSQKDEYGYKTLHRKGQESVQILRLKGKNRAESRRVQRQRTPEDWHEPEDESLADEISESL
jgi:ribosome biogenesis GTPase